MGAIRSELSVSLSGGCYPVDAIRSARWARFFPAMRWEAGRTILPHVHPPREISTAKTREAAPNSLFVGGR
jgi:hypothetical protein